MAQSYRRLSYLTLQRAILDTGWDVSSKHGSPADGRVACPRTQQNDSSQGFTPGPPDSESKAQTIRQPLLRKGTGQ